MRKPLGVQMTVAVLTALTVAPLTLLGSPLLAQARAFTPNDWYRVTTVSAPAVSPDGKQVAVTVTTVRSAENKRHSEIWLVAAAGGGPVRPTAAGGGGGGRSGPADVAGGRKRRSAVVAGREAAALFLAAAGRQRPHLGPSHGPPGRRGVRSGQHSPGQRAPRRSLRRVGGGGHRDRAGQHREGPV